MQISRINLFHLPTINRVVFPRNRSWISS